MKKVYVVNSLNTFDGTEIDIISVRENFSDARDDMKKDFADMVNDIKEEHPDVKFEIKEFDRYCQIFDTYGGDYYEVSIITRELT